MIAHSMYVLTWKAQPISTTTPRAAANPLRARDTSSASGRAGTSVVTLLPVSSRTHRREPAVREDRVNQGPEVVPAQRSAEAGAAGVDNRAHHRTSGSVVKKV